MSTPQNPPMAEHPDFAEVARGHELQEVRMRYERAAETVTGQVIEGVILLAGLYLALSGWIVGFTGPLQTHNLIIGLAIAVLGFGFGAAYGSTHRLAWVCPVLGVWTIVALWAVSGAAGGIGAMLTNILAGAVVLLAGLALLGAPRMGGGTILRTREGHRTR
ncbi:SPW repeat protein [Pseudonocardia sp. C8]|uniref:SPW repeat protein n=1 Tax=Pseudonocardia sp. C8 TaxID=2762759 RepID=UPI00164344BD|nr:SPW repeat protein [Pseudonocardia sp. C8]MBC3190952.1 SPW repeat protein [Pseudonocardia sp. C8]